MGVRDSRTVEVHQKLEQPTVRGGILAKHRIHRKLRSRNRERKMGQSRSFALPVWGGRRCCAACHRDADAQKHSPREATPKLCDARAFAVPISAFGFIAPRSTALHRDASEKCRQRACPEIPLLTAAAGRTSAA
jgi:hypothetical protein